jgi:hypothetical protein
MKAELDVQGRDPRLWRVSEASTIEQFFAGQAKRVLYFGGYGELGYEQSAIVGDIAARILGRWAPHQIIVLTGTLLRVGGHDGIADVYRIARRLGIQTAGIHPSIAQDFAATHQVSPDCDDVFFVRDSSWGGSLGSRAVSPTLRLHLSVSDELVVIGGGKHAADELRAFIERGRPVQYFPAEMNRAAALEWSRRSGVELQDLRGAAWHAWSSLQRGIDPRVSGSSHGGRR